MKKAVPYSSYINLLRIRGWLGYFLISILGFFLSKSYAEDAISIFRFYAAMALYLAFSFSINDCFDVEEDKENKKRVNPVAEGIISRRKCLLFSITPALAGILFATNSTDSFVFYISMLFISFFYSSPPLRFKSKPIADVVSHGMFFGTMIFLFPFIFFSSPIDMNTIIIAYTIFHFSVVLELRNHIEDFEHDSRAGLKTSAVFFGLERVTIISKILVVLFPVAFFPLFIHSYLIAFFILLTLIFYVLFYATENYRTFDVYASIVYMMVVVMAI